MTNAELLAKIKAEIERRIDILSKVSVEEAKKGNFDMSHYYHGKDVALEELLSFLSTLESEKPTNLEEEIKKEMVKLPFFIRGKDQIAFARHFAQWGAEHLKK